MNLATKIVKHIMLVTKHRWIVFKLAIKAGIPWRGFVHDLSKFSPTEFFESVKYYNGKRSPLHVARENIGYSKAWLHHKGRNKHHFEYWVDISKTEQIGVFLPYKYMVEAVCDKLSAGMVYNGKKWTKEEPLKYWNDIEKNAPVVKHPGTIEFMDIVLKKIADEGIDEAVNRKYLKETYKKIEEKYFSKKKDYRA
ncbi:MAG: catalase [Clostridia bacterium]|nr:catalase [Clostridia bacterium]